MFYTTNNIQAKLSLVIELLQIHLISGWRKQVPKRVLIKYSSYHFADPETELDPRVPRISKLATTRLNNIQLETKW